MCLPRFSREATRGRNEEDHWQVRCVITAIVFGLVMHDQEAILVGPELLVVTEIPCLCVRAPLCTIVQATSVGDICRIQRGSPLLLDIVSATSICWLQTRASVSQWGAAAAGDCIRLYLAGAPGAAVASENGRVVDGDFLRANENGTSRYQRITVKNPRLA